jgi:hypothetical protein
MSNSQRKWERHEVLTAEKAPPSFLDWSGDAITFGREDHPNRIPNSVQYPLVVEPVIGNSRFSKVLMDGGGQPQHLVRAHPTADGNRVGPAAAQHDAVPWRCAGQACLAIGQIDLSVWFGMLDNFHKETLTFEVVGFRGTYHTILGRSCYAKFMAIPNYTYLKMKMLGQKASSPWARRSSTHSTAASSAWSMPRC